MDKVGVEESQLFFSSVKKKMCTKQAIPKAHCDWQWRQAETFTGNSGSIQTTNSVWDSAATFWLESLCNTKQVEHTSGTCPVYTDVLP